MDRRINIVLVLVATLFVFNGALAVWVIRAFRLLPGHDLAERVKIAEGLASQVAHNHTNVMQALEFERHYRQRNGEKIDRVIAILEGAQTDETPSG